MAQSRTRDQRIDFRVPQDIKLTIEKAASLKNKTLSAYIIDHVLPSAEKDIKELETISLNNSDRNLFYDLLNNPPKPNDALRKLMHSDNK